MLKNTVVEFYGNQTKAANALNVTRSCVSAWNSLIPEKQALLLDRITEGALKYDPSLYESKNSQQTKH